MFTNKKINDMIQMCQIIYTDIYSRKGRIRKMENMELYERIQFLRKMLLKMSRKDFAQRLGVSPNTIVNLEMNRLARPEQKEPIVRLICIEFGVNEKWLRQGIGEAFDEGELDINALIASDILESKEDEFYQIMKKIMKTYRTSRPAMQQYIKEFCKAIQEA